eukprot:758441-Hanusia_phi.AAC.1
MIMSCKPICRCRLSVEDGGEQAGLVRAEIWCSVLFARESERPAGGKSEDGGEERVKGNEGARSCRGGGQEEEKEEEEERGGGERRAGKEGSRVET